jgi:hypothetical protein
MRRFPADPADITVYGGWDQWGRKDATHTFRCAPSNPITSDACFTLIPVSNPNVNDDGKFVYGRPADPGNWTDPHVVNSALWGNGLTLASGGNNPVKGSGDPCPPGFRVPTQHEWALIGQEHGSSTTYTDDRFTATANATLARSGIVWVRVVNGRTNSAWNSSSMCGFVLYDPITWANAHDDYKDGTSPLYELAAPEPLMFLPAAGHRALDGLPANTGTYGRYWGSTLSDDDNFKCMILRFLSTDVSTTYGNARAYGFSVRCIAE